MKLCFASVPSRFARPIVRMALLVQYVWPESTATLSVLDPPLMRVWFTSVPSRFARSMVPAVTLVQ